MSLVCLVTGALAAVMAVINERRMQRHRLPGVSYAAATFRRDGGWRRADLFDARGLAYQRVAACFGVAAAILWALALMTWVVLGV